MTRRKWPKQMPTSVQSKKSRRLEYVVQLGGLIINSGAFVPGGDAVPAINLARVANGTHPRPEKSTDGATAEVKSDAAAPGLHGEKIRSQVEQTVKRQNLTVTKLPDLAELEWGPVTLKTRRSELRRKYVSYLLATDNASSTTADSSSSSSCTHSSSAAPSCQLAPNHYPIIRSKYHRQLTSTPSHPTQSSGSKIEPQPAIILSTSCYILSTKLSTNCSILSSDQSLPISNAWDFKVFNRPLAQRSIQAAEVGWMVYQNKLNSSQEAQPFPSNYSPAHHRAQNLQPPEPAPVQLISQSIALSDLFLQLQIDCQVLSPYASHQPWLRANNVQSKTTQSIDNDDEMNPHLNQPSAQLFNQSLDLLLDPYYFDSLLERYDSLYHTVNLPLRQHQQLVIQQPLHHHQHPQAKKTQTTILEDRLVIYFLGVIQAFTNYLLEVIIAIVQTRLPYPSAIQAHHLVGFIAQDDQIINFLTWRESSPEILITQAFDVNTNHDQQARPGSHFHNQIPTPAGSSASLTPLHSPFLPVSLALACKLPPRSQSPAHQSRTHLISTIPLPTSPSTPAIHQAVPTSSPHSRNSATTGGVDQPSLEPSYQHHQSAIPRPVNSPARPTPGSESHPTYRSVTIKRAPAKSKARIPVPAGKTLSPTPPTGASQWLEHHTISAAATWRSASDSVHIASIPYHSPLSTSSSSIASPRSTRTTPLIPSGYPHWKPSSTAAVEQADHRPKSVKSHKKGHSIAQPGISFEQLMRSNETVKFSLTPGPCLESSDSPTSRHSTDSLYSPDKPGRILSDPIEMISPKSQASSRLFPALKFCHVLDTKTSGSSKIKFQVPLRPSAHRTHSTPKTTLVPWLFVFQEKLASNMSSMSQRIAASRTPDLNTSSELSKKSLTKNYQASDLANVVGALGLSTPQLVRSETLDAKLSYSKGSSTNFASESLKSRRPSQPNKSSDVNLASQSLVKDELQPLPSMPALKYRQSQTAETESNSTGSFSESSDLPVPPTPRIRQASCIAKKLLSINRDPINRLAVSMSWVPSCRSTAQPGFTEDITIPSSVQETDPDSVGASACRLSSVDHPLVMTLTENSNSSGASRGTITEEREPKKPEPGDQEDRKDLDEIMALASRLNRRFRGSFEQRRAGSFDSLCEMKPGFGCKRRERQEPDQVWKTISRSRSLKNSNRRCQSTAIDEEGMNFKEFLLDKSDRSQKSSRGPEELDVEDGRGIRGDKKLEREAEGDNSDVDGNGEEYISLEGLKQMISKLNTIVDQLSKPASSGQDHDSRTTNHPITGLGIKRVDLLKMMVDQV
ncbi:hypothetical protein H4Q26_012821 [Puccinia striiformis f. sp. tritici PST-130]|nr:hypothetical protein H4Q26_012821 [Puccinia striiformis f. sp. tritici PST-130]